MESSGAATVKSPERLFWAEELKELVDGGEISEAVSFLESVVSDIEIRLKNCQNELSMALYDLSELYSRQGLTQKADDAIFRQVDIELGIWNSRIAEEPVSVGHGEGSSNLRGAEDDRDPNQLLVPEVSKGVSKDLTTEMRRRGTFSLKKCLDSENQNQPDEPHIDKSDSDDEDPRNRRGAIHLTKHVLVLTNFNPTTKFTDMRNFRERVGDQFVFRVLDGSTTLAVFNNPLLASKALKATLCPFSIHVLDEEDEIFSRIPKGDLYPVPHGPNSAIKITERNAERFAEAFKAMPSSSVKDAASTSSDELLFDMQI